MAYLRIATCPINYTVQTHKERERERAGDLQHECTCGGWRGELHEASARGIEIERDK